MQVDGTRFALNPKPLAPQQKAQWSMLFGSKDDFGLKSSGFRTQLDTFGGLGLRVEWFSDSVRYVWGFRVEGRTRVQGLGLAVALGLDGHLSGYLGVSENQGYPFWGVLTIRILLLRVLY